MTAEERAILTELVVAGLDTDGAHHKQWYFEQIAFQFELHLEDALLDYERGIAP